MIDDETTPEERRLRDLFEAVPAPATLRRWDSAGEAGTAARRARLGGSRRRWLRMPSLQGRMVPLALAASISIVAGGALTLVGIRLSGSNGAAGVGGHPAARTGAAMAYDAGNGVTVLFGGQGADGRPLGDTWTWDGSAWTEQHPAHSPRARSDARMAYDAARHVVVLYGGAFDTPIPLGVPNCRTDAPCAAPAPFGAFGPIATWTWGGGDWHMEHPAHHPEAFYGAGEGMAYDAAQQVVVMVTGGARLAAGDGSASETAPTPGSGGSGSSGSGTATSSSGFVPPGSAVTGAASAATPAGPAPPCKPPGPCAPPPGACPPSPPAPAGTASDCAVCAVTAPASSGSGSSGSGPSNATSMPACGPSQPTMSVFGWNGSDWTLLPSPPDPSLVAGIVAVVGDPQGRGVLLVGASFSCGGAVGGQAQPCEGGGAGSGGAAVPQPSGAAAPGAPGAAPGGTPVAAEPPAKPVPAPAPVTVELRFDGTWTTVGAGPLGAAAGAAVALDAANGTLVSHGGALFAPSSSLTEVFDGRLWTVRAGTAPIVVKEALATEPHGVVLFGGYDVGSNRGLSDQTWTWDGARWTLRSGTTSAPTQGTPPTKPAPPPTAPGTACYMTVAGGSPSPVCPPPPVLPACAPGSVHVEVGLPSTLRGPQGEVDVPVALAIGGGPDTKRSPGRAGSGTPAAAPQCAGSLQEGVVVVAGGSRYVSKALVTILGVAGADPFGPSVIRWASYCGTDSGPFALELSRAGHTLRVPLDRTPPCAGGATSAPVFAALA